MKFSNDVEMYTWNWGNQNESKQPTFSYSVEQKLNDFNDAVKKALWFADRLSFKLQSLDIESRSGSVMTLLCTEPQEDQQGSTDELWSH